MKALMHSGHRFWSQTRVNRLPPVVAAFACALVLVGVGAPVSGQDTALEGDDSAEQVETNPRNRRFQKLVIEYLSISPRTPVRKIGDKPQRPDAQEITLEVHLRNLSSERAYAFLFWGGDLGETEIGDIQPGALEVVTTTVTPGEIPYGQVAEITVYDREIHELVPNDTARWHGEQAMRVALLVEDETLERGDEEFGSLVRRMRDSFSALHTLFAKGEASTDSGLKRSPIRDRFRIDHVEPFSRKEGERPALFDDHPEFDLVILCDEGGPIGGFSLPAYSIGHNFADEKTGRGLWSTWGEHALWHELLHFRGVQDYYIYAIPAGALPGRVDRDLPVPRPYARDILNNPYQPAPVIGALTAAVVNYKRGVARVGACEDTDHDFGHMWRWIPETVELTIRRDGAPLGGAEVRWFGSLSVALEDQRVQGVSRERQPDGSGRCDDAGMVRITGDYLGSGKPRSERSLWLLVEVDHPGIDETRFAIVYGLQLNAAYAAGRTRTHWITLDWDEMLPSAGSK